jgi:hypothetical protein
MGSLVGTFAFPNQQFGEDCIPSQEISLRPDFYRGEVEHVGERQSRSVPYPFYRVNFRMHPAASGGPVFGASGHVVGLNTKEMYGSDFGYVAQISCLEGAFIENGSLAADGSPACTTFHELVADGAVRVDAYTPADSVCTSFGRVVHFPMLPTQQPLAVTIRLYA